LLHSYYIHSHIFSIFFFQSHRQHLEIHSFPTRRSSDLPIKIDAIFLILLAPVDGIMYTSSIPILLAMAFIYIKSVMPSVIRFIRSEEHTSELQSRFDLVCRLLLEKKNHNNIINQLIEMH